MGGRQVASHAILGGWPRRMDDLCGSQSSGASDNVEAEDGGDTQVLDRQGGQLLQATEMKNLHQENLVGFAELVPIGLSFINM